MFRNMKWIVTINTSGLVFLACLAFVLGRIEINNLDYPKYVLSESQLKLNCTSNRPVVLSWVHEHPRTSQSTNIIPTIKSGYITRTLTELPSGYTESLLLHNNVKWQHGGIYTCRDQSGQNFEIWVQVLSIVVEEMVAEPGDVGKLKCKVQGFFNNLPPIDTNWVYNNYTLVSGNKYNITWDKNRGVTTLRIKNPTKKDVGDYSCHFVLYSTSAHSMFSKTVSLYGPNLPSSAPDSRFSLLLVVAMVTSLVTMQNILTLVT